MEIKQQVHATQAVETSVYYICKQFLMHWTEEMYPDIEKPSDKIRAFMKLYRIKRVVTLTLLSF